MLNEKQKHVVFDLPGNAIVSASPGSGKTKTLVARAQHKLVSLPPFKKLALITYTNAGADEIADRLISNGNTVFTGTIHRFCLEFILRPFGWLYKWKKPRVLTYDELLEFIELNKDLDLGEDRIDNLGKIKKTLKGEVDLTKRWTDDDSYKRVVDRYYEFVESKNAIDFNEILYRSYKIILENDFVVTSLANKFYEILVDEFQDTNIYQYEILKIINLKSICTFFLVGDEKQRILRFAGAIDNAFGLAAVDFNAPIEVLEEVYRSTQSIVNGYSSLFMNHPALINQSPFKEDDKKIVIKETTKNNHNKTVEDIINELIEDHNISISDIAILSTSWRDCLNISRHLRPNIKVVGLGSLPHRNLGNSTFALLRSLSKFLYSPTIRHIRYIRRGVEMHLLENSQTLAASEFSFVTNALISKFSEVDQELSLNDGIAELKKIFDSVFGIEHPAFTEIVELIDDDEISQWTLQKYLETLAGVDGITINTIHQAKGLEYTAVILNQMNENKIPYQQYLGKINGDYRYGPITNESMEDGRTLFYVGISRAKTLLIILHNFKPSTFIGSVRLVN